MDIYHHHHIVPRHMGGSDDPSNIVKLTVKEHAQAHLDLYNKHGDERDLLAYRMLLGQVSTAEARLTLAKLPKKESHKKKISEALKGEKNPMYGKKQCQNQIDAVRKASLKSILVDGVVYPSIGDAIKNSNRTEWELRDKYKFPRV